MNSKIWKVLIWIFSALIILAIGLAIYFYIVNNQQAREERNKEDSAWQTYTSTKYSYQVQFPQNWYLVTDGYEPIYEQSLIFSSHQDYATEFAHTNLGITALSEEALVEIQTFIDAGYTQTITKVDGIEAIQMVNWNDLNTIVSATFFEKDNQHYKLTIGPVDVNKYNEILKQEIYDKFLKSFKFIDIEDKNKPNVAHAASYVLDQHYDPATDSWTEIIVSAQKQIGQTFKPTYNNVAKIEVELKIPSGECTMGIHLNNSVNTVLAQKTMRISDFYVGSGMRVSYFA